MNIVVHYPEITDELNKKAAAIYGDALLRYLEKLSWPNAQKLEALSRIKAGL